MAQVNFAPVSVVSKSVAKRWCVRGRAARATAHSSVPRVRALYLPHHTHPSAAHRPAPLCSDRARVFSLSPGALLSRDRSARGGVRPVACVRAGPPGGARRGAHVGRAAAADHQDGGGGGNIRGGVRGGEPRVGAARRGRRAAARHLRPRAVVCHTLGDSDRSEDSDQARPLRCDEAVPRLTNPSRVRSL